MFAFPRFVAVGVRINLSAASRLLLFEDPEGDHRLLSGLADVLLSVVSGFEECCGGSRESILAFRLKAFSSVFRLLGVYL